VIRGLPGGIRVVCGLGSLGTRGATGGIRGKLSLADLAVHSGLAGGIRDSPGVSLGTRGDSEGSRGSLLFRHSERVASSGGFRRVLSAGGTRGQVSRSESTRRVVGKSTG